MLLLAWKMGAQRMGFFARDEFCRGMGALGAASVDKLRKALPKLEEEVDADPEAFASFFAFAFRFCCTVRRPATQAATPAGLRGTAPTS